MSKGDQAAFYKTKLWKDARKAYMTKVGGLCERCLAKGIIKPAEIIHHRIHLDAAKVKDPKIATDFSNLEALCRDCHAEEHAAHQRRYQVDEDGRVWVPPGR